MDKYTVGIVDVQIVSNMELSLLASTGVSDFEQQITNYRRRCVLPFLIFLMEMVTVNGSHSFQKLITITPLSIQY